MKALKETTRKYYKYEVLEQSWTQPSISSSGTVGGNSFAVTSSSALGNRSSYHALDSTGWVATSSTGYFIFYNPVAIKVVGLKFSETGSGIYGTCYINSYDLYGSNNNASWIKIGTYTQGSGTKSNDINNNTYYKYYKIQALSSNNLTAMANLVIYALEDYTKIVEADSSDYDFYRDEGIYKILTTQTLGTKKTFYPSSEIQSWTVPEGITSIHVDCVASRGAPAIWGNTNKGIGGAGGRVQCDLAVTEGQILYFVIGLPPEDGRYASYNASDIRTDNTGITDNISLSSRLIIAGGGGSSGYGSNNGFKQGGDGGGLIGEDGQGDAGTGNKQGYYGTGGTQSAGGISHNNNTATQGQLGLGGNSVINSYRLCGAGGSGYYGGGGADGTGYHSGDTESWGAGGGGGSSYTNSDCSNVTHTQGYNSGIGYITISSTDAIFPVNSYKLLKE